MQYVVVVADGWGYTFGGINVFNKLLCEAMAKQTYNSLINVICIAPDIEVESIKESRDKGLVLLSVSKDDLNDANSIILKLKKENSFTEEDEVFWIGHDTYTDDIALKCRDAWMGSRCAIIHHMAYGKYYPLLNKDTHESEAKEKHQKATLQKADLVFANGPVLTRNAQDIVGDKEKVKIIYPGVVDVGGARKYINNDFAVVTFGRIEQEKGLKRNNTIIKQIYLAVAAWAEFAKTYLVSSDDTVMKVYGENEEEQSNKELDNILSKYSDSVYALSSIAYETNREVLLNDLAEFSVCMVLSLREGFGLTALEAVSAGVPLIVSKKSGFYSMLREKRLENYVHGVDIQGKTDEPYFTETDLKNVQLALYDIYKDQKKAKEDVFILKEKLKECSVTWEKCADDVLREIDPYYNDSDWEDDDFCLHGFSETKGVYDDVQPTIYGGANSSSVGVVCLGEQVDLSVRDGAVGPGDIDECLEYIKLAAYYNERLPYGHRFKVRSMFLEKINPSHLARIEYLYHQDEKPLYSEDEIKELFHDEDELWCGIINTVWVKITKVNMQSDYFFENGPQYDTLDGFN